MGVSNQGILKCVPRRVSVEGVTRTGERRCTFVEDLSLHTAYPGVLDGSVSTIDFGDVLAQRLDRDDRYAPLKRALLIAMLPPTVIASKATPVMAPLGLPPRPFRPCCCALAMPC